jgi:GH43 family beta-xylosidase
MLTASSASDLTDAASWKKSPLPVFRQAPKNNTYAPGQITFFTTPDGKESWMFYHANTGKGQGCNRLSPRMQKYGWNKDGTPLFGNPMKPGMVLSAPYTDLPE